MQGHSGTFDWILEHISGLMVGESCSRYKHYGKRKIMPSSDLGVDRDVYQGYVPDDASVHFVA
jgi:hypothetical protein